MVKSMIVIWFRDSIGEGREREREEEERRERRDECMFVLGL